MTWPSSPLRSCHQSYRPIRISIFIHAAPGVRDLSWRNLCDWPMDSILTPTRTTRLTIFTSWWSHLSSALATGITMSVIRISSTFRWINFLQMIMCLRAQISLSSKGRHPACPRLAPSQGFRFTKSDQRTHLPRSSGNQRSLILRISVSSMKLATYFLRRRATQWQTRPSSQVWGLHRLQGVPNPGQILPCHR